MPHSAWGSCWLGALSRVALADLRVLRRRHFITAERFLYMFGYMPRMGVQQTLERL